MKLKFTPRILPVRAGKRLSRKWPSVEMIAFSTSQRPRLRMMRNGNGSSRMSIRDRRSGRRLRVCCPQSLVYILLSIPAHGLWRSVRRVCRRSRSRRRGSDDPCLPCDTSAHASSDWFSAYVPCVVWSYPSSATARHESRVPLLVSSEVIPISGCRSFFLFSRAG